MHKIKEILNIKDRTRYFVWVLSVCAFSSVLLFIVSIQSITAGANQENLETKPDFFADISLAAKGAIVWDPTNQRELFGKNADLSLPLASLTKIMTAIIAHQALDDERQITITEEYLKPEGDSGLLVGDRWSIKDLLDFTLLTSSNDGAYALASVAGASLRTAKGQDFTAEMNELASIIGLSNSHFWNEHGLDKDADRGGAYGSARDVALLFEYASRQYPSLLEATRYNSLSFYTDITSYSASNTNVFADQVPGLIASKTGFTDLAGGNLGIVFDVGLNRPIIIVVLGSTQEERFTDTLKLVEASMRAMAN